MSQHTKGPYIVQEYDEVGGVSLSILGALGYGDDPSDRRVIADITLCGSGLPEDEQAHYAAEQNEDRANAHLLAASPDLLDALKGLLAHVTIHYTAIGGHEAQEALKQARAAIVKAEGEATA